VSGLATSRRWLARSDSGLALTLALLFVLLILALASPPFFGRVHVADDLGNLHLPVRGVYQAGLQAHQSVLWSPHLYGGMYLHGEGQAGMYHPLHWVLYRFLPLSWAFTLEFILSYVVMFPGMYLLLRRFDLPHPEGLFGAIVFTFSGFNLLHFMHVNAIAVVAHLPWLLFAIDLLLRSTDRREVTLAQLTISLGTGSQLLLGHPQFVWLSVLAEVALVTWRLRTAVSLWRVALLAWAVSLGVLLGSVQLLPSVEALAGSHRANPSAEFRSTYSLHIANLLQLVSPYGLRGRVVGGNVQEFGLYNGALCSVAVGWLFLRRHELGRFRSLVLAAFGFAVVMLIVALGSHGGLYPLVSQIPGIGVFRAPARYILLVHLALAIITAVMMADLRHMAHRTERAGALRLLWPLTVVAGLSLIALACHAWLVSHPDRYPWAVYLWPFGFAALGTGLILIASLLVVASLRGIRWAPWLLAVFTVADLTLWGGSFVWRERPQPLATYIDRVPPPPSDARSWRIHVTGNMDWLYQNSLILKGYRLASGYVGLRPTRTLSPEDVTAQRLLGVRWVFSNGRWDEVGGPLPRVRLVAEGRLSHDIRGDLGRIDVQRTVLVSEPVGQLGPGPEGTARILRDEPGLIEVSTTSPNRQLLVLSEAYHAGWTATGNDRPRKIYRAYGDLQACVVEAGDERIVFRFEPWSFTLGQRLSASALMLMAATSIAVIVLGRRKAAITGTPTRG
jgi:uncharacterized membrane protein YozB (DUF420 family)